jgi:hypothetical protein
MILNEDYKEMLRCLSEENVKFLLIGAYALGAYGYLRATMDIDIWVKPSPENARAVLKALRRFGAPLHGLTTPISSRMTPSSKLASPPAGLIFLPGPPDFALTRRGTTPLW